MSGSIDISDRAARLIGAVTGITNAITADVSDRAARLIGVVNSITNPVDISDRAARLIGVVNSITNPICDAGPAWTWINATLVPSAGTILLDTGPLPAGDYEAKWGLGSYPQQDVVGLQHRDAANAVTLHEQADTTGALVQANLYLGRTTLALNERLRLWTYLSGGLYTYRVWIMYRKVA